MNFSSSFKKSFKSHGSYKHSRRISADDDDRHHEEQPILSRHPAEPSSSHSIALMNERPEVIVKIDNGREGIRKSPSLWPDWRDDDDNAGPETDSFEFHRGSVDGSRTAEDPPSRLVNQFIDSQRAAGTEIALDMEMDELRANKDRTSSSSPKNIPAVNEKIMNRNETGKVNRTSTSKDVGFSFQAPPNLVDIVPDERKEDIDLSDEDDEASENGGSVHSRIRMSNRFSNLDGDMNRSVANDDNGQVLKCTSFQRRGSNVLGRLKTKSRLMDPPEMPDLSSVRAGKSGPLRSGLLERNSGMLAGKPNEEEEEDPLLDEDIPEEYRNCKFDALTFLQWVSLVVIGTALICTLAIPMWKKKKLRGLSLWKWDVLLLVLICGRLVSGWAIRIVVFFIERNFFMRKRVLYFVYGVRKAVQNCIWLGLVLIAWHSMFDKKLEAGNKFLRYVNKVMVCMLVGTLLWLVKTLMVKVLASSFHVSTFFDRIQESLFNQYVIGVLSGPPLIEIQNHQEEEKRTKAEIQKLQNAGAVLPPELTIPSPELGKSGRMPPKPSKGLSFKIPEPQSKSTDDQGISIDHLHRLNHKNISAWNMKRLMNIVRHGSLSTLDEQVIGTAHGDETATQIRSEREAKRAARKIFHNVAKPRAKFIYIEDLMRFLREEEALKTMTLLEGSPESEKISKASLKNWVVNAFRERRALALTLNDTKTAVKKLHHMVNVIVGIIILVACLIILEIATSKFLLLVSSQIVVAAFIFGNTCKTIFEAIIFVFIMHPFDVGDRCEVDGVQMIVEEMNILTTVFLRFDNQKILYPNVTLATKPISNYYRSPDMGDSVDFAVHIATPAEKIAIMKQRIVSYIENKKDHWYPTPTVVLMNFEELNRLKFSVWLRHRMNHQDMGEKWLRRAALVDEMVKIFKELDIEYRLYPIDINVRALPPPNSSRLPSTWSPPSNE